MSLQRDAAAGLLAVKRRCESAYHALSEIAHITKNNFGQITAKLSYSAAALEYCGEAAVLLDDITSSFKETFLRGQADIAADFMQRITAVTENIHFLALKCDSIQSIPKPYSDAISLYTARMESALKTFEDKSNSKRSDITALCEAFAKTAAAEQGS